MDWETHLQALLANAAASGLLRSPRAYVAAGSAVSDDDASLVSLASNDYLGLAEHPELRASLAEGASIRAGAGSSRVVAGTTPAHQSAEAALAGFVNLATVRLFTSAYAANTGLLGNLLGAPDLVVSDSLNHASLIDGCRLSRARVLVYEHGDLQHLTGLLRAHRTTARVAAIVTESAFSMDGDVADVRALRRIADEHGAALIVDEAHTLGVAGPRGAGVCVDASVRPDVLIGGLGKAFGLAGGFVAGSTALARSIDNFARTFVFSTAMLPAIAHAVPTAVRLVAEADPERTSLHAHVTALRSVARRSGRPAGYAPSAIVPFFIGDPDRAMRISSAFRERGYLIPAMRPPTVPEGTARLRMTPTALHSPAQIDRLCALLEELIPSPGDREHDDHPNHP